jgi:hypothetical protein
MTIDEAYELSLTAREGEDWPTLAQCIDTMQAWLLSDEAQEYAVSSRNCVRDYVSMVLLTHGHKLARVELGAE